MDADEFLGLFIYYYDEADKQWRELKITNVTTRQDEGESTDEDEFTCEAVCQDDPDTVFDMTAEQVRTAYSTRVSDQSSYAEYWLDRLNREAAEQEDEEDDDSYLRYRQHNQQHHQQQQQHHRDDDEYEGENVYDNYGEHEEHNHHPHQAHLNNNQRGHNQRNHHQHQYHEGGGQEQGQGGQAVGNNHNDYNDYNNRQRRRRIKINWNDVRTLDRLIDANEGLREAMLIYQSGGYAGYDPERRTINKEWGMIYDIFMAMDPNFRDFINIYMKDFTRAERYTMTPM